MHHIVSALHRDMRLDCAANNRTNGKPRCTGCTVATSTAIESTAQLAPHSPHANPSFRTLRTPSYFPSLANERNSSFTTPFVPEFSVANVLVGYTREQQPSTCPLARPHLLQSAFRQRRSTGIQTCRNRSTMSSKSPSENSIKMLSPCRYNSSSKDCSVGQPGHLNMSHTCLVRALQVGTEYRMVFRERLDIQERI